MFSYRHAFHAGNHADVLKHAILVHILDYFNRKDTPYQVVDTHAGAGLYALDDRAAAPGAEWRDGIGRLWQRSDLPTMLAAYVAQVARHNSNGGQGPALRGYPGSPWLALTALRPRDRLRLFELHPTEARVLAANLAQCPPVQQRQTRCCAADGFAGVKALLPPPSRRGLVLIDPSFEDRRNYRHVLDTVRDSLRRFVSGCYVVWYPHAQRREAVELPRQLAKLPTANWLHATLAVRRADASGHGLHASGVFVVNPPWTLVAALRETLPWLARTLAQDDDAGYTLAASAQGN